MRLQKTIALGAGILGTCIVLSAHAYVQDPQLTNYRADKGKSAVWLSHEDSSNGLGDVGSSKDSAFEGEGSSRFRFKRDVSNHNFSAMPGLSQLVRDLPANTDMVFSLFYCDKKGNSSPTQLYFGVREVGDASLTGNMLAETRAHVRDLADAPQGENKKCFRQVSIDFNTGDNNQVEIFSLLEVDTSTTPSLDKELEVRVDAFSISRK
ncbi:hypothetical protein AHAT_12100 [Agarivorans sp. Toyoura001]|uniref:hypothetical protein n=1 Tax=Agarivorans sp. Toyoura001 TaxID=2283141 RepID=UPI0010DF6365|nr:hypothetical protein [Agarivorans sp. Toyoura001]GDY25320.1 hypothetical protein AHAT_12100 [Agarivorans sp. Toyoura001]